MKALNTWQDISEIVLGLILTNRVDRTKFNSSMFVSPYDKGFEVFLRSNDHTSVIDVVSDGLYSACMEAQGTVGDSALTDVDWHRRLLKVSKTHRIGENMANLSKRALRGEELTSQNVMDITAQLKDIANPDAIGLQLSTDIKIDPEPWMLTGWKPIDEHLGGIPKAGPILLMGGTGVGKSLWSQSFVGAFLKKYPEKRAAFYSLEMGAGEFISRGIKLYPDFRAAHEQGRILVSDRTTNIDDIGIEVAAVSADIVVVDYADYVVADFSEASFAQLYVKMNNIQRTLGIPFIMLLQPNRNQYSSGVPYKHYARYSGMAENVAALFLAIFSPKDAEETGDDFTFIDDSMYLIVWKSRFGWKTEDRLHEDGKSRQGPGAIVMPQCRRLWDANSDSEWLRHKSVPSTTRRKKRSDDD
jgi:hypothetical protein